MTSIFMEVYLCYAIIMHTLSPVEKKVLNEICNVLEIDKALVAVGLTYLLMISGMFPWCVRQSAEVDNLVSI